MTPPAVAFSTLVQDFFQRRLVAERGVSAHTVASYRDTLKGAKTQLCRREPTSAPFRGVLLDASTAAPEASPHFDRPNAWT